MIEIPFLPEFKEALASGKKTATTRTKRYGKAGEIFTAFGMKFEIMDIVKKPLDEIRTFFFDDEGFNNPKEFEIVWNKIHPKGYELQKDELFYFHTFKRVD